MDDLKSQGYGTKSWRNPDLHEELLNTYHNKENEIFYDLAFDYIVNNIGPAKGSKFLDAGCGTHAPHSVRLAKKGFFVEAIDFSEAALQTAQENIKNKGLSEQINFQHASLLSLPYRDNTFDYILCWGVLMHIPDIKKAISELSRVLSSGGLLIVSEANMFSLQSIVNSFVKKVRNVFLKKYVEIKSTPAGVEYWLDDTMLDNATGDIGVTRETNMQWLIKEFKDNEVIIKKRVAGQFTELYIKFSSPLATRYIHTLNNVWFKYLRFAGPAFGNILFFTRR